MDMKDFNFIEDTKNIFELPPDRSKWTEKHITDWFYWIRHKLRFKFPKITKQTLDLRSKEVSNIDIWKNVYGNIAGEYMYKEFELLSQYEFIKSKSDIGPKYENEFMKSKSDFGLKYENEFMKSKSEIELKYENEFMKSKLDFGLKYENEFMKSKSDFGLKYENDSMKSKSDIGPKYESEYSKSSSDKPKRRNEKKDGLYLWQILLTMLLNDEFSYYISWTDPRKGMFKIKDPNFVSIIWGESKGNKNMTYDKMSRSMRQYYKSNLLKKTNHDKLNYCFNMDDSSVKKFIIRCREKLPDIRIPSDLVPKYTVS